MIDLRELRDEDEERLFYWRREPEVDRWMSDLAPTTLDEHRLWFGGFRADPDRRGWIITADESGAALNMKSPISDYPSGRGVWKLSVEYVPDEK